MPGNGPYQAYFCEENIFRLVEARVAHAGAEVWVLSNLTRQMLMLNQRRGDPDMFGAIVWDYHVVYFDGRGRVFDFDTCLPFGVPVNAYIAQSFAPASLGVPETFAPQIRCVDAACFLERFWSNRDHMRTDAGNFLTPPPPWPAIVRTPSRTTSLDAFISMDNSDAPGRVYSATELAARFAAEAKDEE